MMTIDITSSEPINITPMSAQEARECITAIKGNLESLRLMLLELHSRRGWEALGYNSWEDCAREEFGLSRSYVFQLLTAAQVEVNLTSNAKSTIVDLEDIPVSQLTALAKLPPEQQVEGLLLADQIAIKEGKKRNAAHIAQAVQEINPKKQTKNQSVATDLANPTNKPKTGWNISPQQLSTTIKEHKIAVHFEHRGDGYHFGFKGPEHTISASGFHSEYVHDRAFVNREYLNPGVWADFRAEELYADYQKSLEQDNQRVGSRPSKIRQPLTCDLSTPTSNPKTRLPDFTGFNEADEYTSESVNIDDDTKEEDAAVPSEALTKNQMLPAAVETCLGEFWMPQSLNEPLQGKIYLSPNKAFPQWASKLLKAYKSDQVKEAIALFPLGYQVFIKFSNYALCPLPDDLVVVYLGKRVDNFILCFEDLGMVWHRYGWRP